MAPRAKKSARLASSASRTQVTSVLTSVRPGHYARLASGVLVRRCAELNLAIFVRDARIVAGVPRVDESSPLRQLPHDTEVVEVIAPSLEASDRGAVLDPLDRGAA